jgi:glycosyltransferase involved in cell wall biosynthesis
MCGAFSELGHNVVLFARSNSHNQKEVNTLIEDYYGISNKQIKVKIFRSKIDKGAELFIAIFSFIWFIKDYLRSSTPVLIFSRNIYAAFFFSLVLKKNIIYETHTPEKNLRGTLQSWLLRKSNIYCIVISHALQKILVNKYNVSKKSIYVMHDAAQKGFRFSNKKDLDNYRLKLLGGKINLKKYNKIIGYFGHLYPGRGINIIKNLAVNFQDYAFVLFGGNETDLQIQKNTNFSDNIYFMGFIEPKKVRKAMSSMDVLLMPYQKSVSIGIDNYDTAKWMSPLKLFEYMSVGVPIISSDLDVLKEVIKNNRNSIMVPPEDAFAWRKALITLASNYKLGRFISKNAYNDFSNKYTWKSRAKSVIEIFNKCNKKEQR